MAHQQGKSDLKDAQHKLAEVAHKTVDESLESLSSFDPGVIGRGFWLTLVGAYRALQNPALFQNQHYRQAAMAVAAGIAIRILLALPILLVRIVVGFLGFFINLKDVTWDDDLVNGIDFLEKHVLQVPFFLMTALRHVSPSLDDMFMESLRWVDYTYSRKHQSEDPSTLRAQYYPNLVLWAQQPKIKHSTETSNPRHKQSAVDAFQPFIMRSGRKAAISIVVYLLSYIPYIGKFVLPAASFYSLHKAAGVGPAALISIVGLFLPKRYLAVVLQAYYASRSLMRELLVPYFSRLNFTKDQKQLWFKDREGLLFGFSVGFYLLIRIPLFGVLIYGIAEASTAYLVTKITDPPPPPTSHEANTYLQSQVAWRAKEDFMQLPLNNLDKLNEKMVHLKSQLHSGLSKSEKHEYKREELSEIRSSGGNQSFAKPEAAAPYVAGEGYTGQRKGYVDSGL